MTDNDLLDLERAAQRAAELRLAEAGDRWHAEQDGADLDVWDGFPGGAFCGCDTCVVREVLDAAWPHLEQLFEAVRLRDLETSSEVEER